MRSLALFILILMFVPGCSLIPKPVEFFQSKVKAVPEKSNSSAEYERQAANYIQNKLQDAVIESFKGSVTNKDLLTPLLQANTVAPGLATSLGPPAKPWTGNPTNLNWKLLSELSDFNKDLNKYREKTEPLVGKKIEGSGIFSIPYVVWVAMVGGLVLILYIVIRAVIQALAISSGTSVPVQIGLKTATGVGNKLVKAGFSQVIHGVESFKDYIKTTEQATFSKEEVLDLVREHQERKQSPEVQNVIKELTRK